MSDEDQNTTTTTRGADLETLALRAQAASRLVSQRDRDHALAAVLRWCRIHRPGIAPWPVQIALADFGVLLEHGGGDAAADDVVDALEKVADTRQYAATADDTGASLVAYLDEYATEAAEAPPAGEAGPRPARTHRTPDGRLVADTDIRKGQLVWVDLGPGLPAGEPDAAPAAPAGPPGTAPLDTTAWLSEIEQAAGQGTYIDPAKTLALVGLVRDRDQQIQTVEDRANEARNEAAHAQENHAGLAQAAAYWKDLCDTATRDMERAWEAQAGLRQATKDAQESQHVHMPPRDMWTVGSLRQARSDLVEAANEPTRMAAGAGQEVVRHYIDRTHRIAWRVRCNNEADGEVNQIRAARWSAASGEAKATRARLGWDHLAGLAWLCLHDDDVARTWADAMALALDYEPDDLVGENVDDVIREAKEGGTT